MKVFAQVCVGIFIFQFTATVLYHWFVTTWVW